MSARVRFAARARRRPLDVDIELVGRRPRAAPVRMTGKSLTATPWRARSCPWRSRPRFASSLRRRALAGPRTRAVLDDGRQHGEQDQGARARPALGACATRPGHACNMIQDVTEHRSKRHPGAASISWMQLCASRQCATAGCSSCRSSQHIAPRRRQARPPQSRQVVPERV